MQFGQTMYNQMLTDMGLNISSAPKKPAEVVQPAAQPAVQALVQQVIQPAVQQVIQPAAAPAKPSGSGKTKWLIIGGVIVLLLFILLIVVGLVGFVLYTQYR